MQHLKLKSSEFRREREANWRELDRLIRRVEEEGVGTLTAEELARLPVLHRGAVSSLSVARAISLDRNLLDYLEGLSARSFYCVYAAKRPAWETLERFFLERFPSAVRAIRWQLLIAALAMGSGILAGHALTQADMDRYYSFVPEGIAQGRNPSTSTSALRDALYSDGGGVEGALATFASFLFSHNSSVGILSFGIGFAAGVPVVPLLFWNGLILGAMAALYGSRGLASEFWAWILPHGVTELGAVVLCGAAGLLLGHAVVFPGPRSRISELAVQGRRAGSVVLGAVCMLFLAALVEGFFRQLVHSVPARWSLAVASLVLWSVYFLRTGARRAA